MSTAICCADLCGSVASQQQPSARPTLNIHVLKGMSIQGLTQIAKDLAVAGATGMRKQDLIFQILKAQTERSGRSAAVEGPCEAVVRRGAGVARV